MAGKFENMKINEETARYYHGFQSKQARIDDQIRAIQVRMNHFSFFFLFFFFGLERKLK